MNLRLLPTWIKLIECWPFAKISDEPGRPAVAKADHRWAVDCRRQLPGIGNPEEVNIFPALKDGYLKPQGNRFWSFHKTLSILTYLRYSYTK